MGKKQIKSVSSLIRGFVGHRFIKFGTVGFSGMIVNLTVLYLSQEYLLREIEPGARLNLSLGVAIFCATINNFAWNRIWTWGERMAMIKKPYLFQMAQYFVACWFSILCQFLFTKVLVHFSHYLIANTLAIFFSAVINYILNDKWTFCVGKKGSF